MRFRSVLALLALSAPAAFGQGRLIDEGTFVITRPGASAQTESFKLVRAEGSQLTATAQLASGTEQITSSLTADSLGTPIRYEFHVRDKGTRILDIRAVALGGRLSALSSNQRGDESMREYAIVPGQSLIVEDDLLHQLYFVALSKRSTTVQVIEPRLSRSTNMVLAAHGFEPVEIAGKSVTATHYTLGTGPSSRDFWVDAGGRVLKAEIPSQRIVAIREEMPR